MSHFYFLLLIGRGWIGRVRSRWWDFWRVGFLFFIFLIELDRFLGFDLGRATGWRFRLALRRLDAFFLLLWGCSLGWCCGWDFWCRLRSGGLGLGLLLLWLGLGGRLHWMDFVELKLTLFFVTEKRRDGRGSERFARCRSCLRRRLGSLLLGRLHGCLKFCVFRLRHPAQFRPSVTAFGGRDAVLLGLAVQGCHRELGGRVRRGPSLRQIGFAALTGSGQ